MYDIDRRRYQNYILLKIVFIIIYFTGTLVS